MTCLGEIENPPFRVNHRYSHVTHQAAWREAVQMVHPPAEDAHLEWPRMDWGAHLEWAREWVLVEMQRVPFSERQAWSHETMYAVRVCPYSTNEVHAAWIVC